MKLSVCIPVHNDYSGVYMTINALREYHDLSDTELVIVDNASHTKHGKAVKNLIANVAEVPAHYFPFTESVGPAQTKDMAIAKATGDAILVIDCHILLVKDAIAQQKAFYDKNPSTMDLYHGPLYADNRKQSGAATHFKPVWSGNMLGVWSTAWRTPEGDLVQTYPNNPKTLDKVTVADLLTNEPRSIPDMPWAGHEATLMKLGWEPAINRIEPFEIPAQGMGLFSCRREAWLKFNPAFREFGGEEGYIHEKFRQAGRKTWCLPWLGWQHRGYRDQPISYPNQTESRFRNYVIGHKELNLPTTELFKHFTWNGLSDKSANEILANPTKYTPAKVAVESNGTPLHYESRIDLFHYLASQPRDLNEHAKYLKKIASQCAHVTEITNRRESSVFLLAGDPEFLISYQEENDAILELQKKLLAKEENPPRPISWTLTTGRFLATPKIAATELLFINSLGTKERLTQELNTNAARVEKHILINGTKSFGKQGEDEGEGLWQAIKPFLTDHPEWFIIYNNPKQQGLTCLSRLPSLKPKYPMRPWIHGYGPGTELKKILEKWGFEDQPGCQCKFKAANMDRLGIEWCFDHVDTVVGWLKEEHTRRESKLPFLKPVVRNFVTTAIDKARQLMPVGGW